MCTVGVRTNANNMKVGEISVLITSKAQSFHWAVYGVKLNIPQEALPGSLKECKIIKVGGGKMTENKVKTIIQSTTNVD